MIYRTSFVIGVVLSGCIGIGRSAESYPPARSAAGIEVTLETRVRTITGELLELREDAYLVREDSAIVLVPRAMVRGGRMQGSPLRSGKRLRLMSRFPNGLTPELLRAVLDAYDQPEVETLEP